MIVTGPQRGLFFACVAVGILSLLSLDLKFAPASLAADETDSDAAPAPEIRPAAASDAGAPAAPARFVIPAPARVPTIVASFESASTEPTDESAIRALATAMIEDHDVSIVLEGHSDTRGGDDYNHTISLERANWVKARLVELGVSPDRIETVGLGATRPLRSDDADAPSVNRRVEVRWLGTAARDEPSPPKPALKAATPAVTAAPRAVGAKRADAAAPPATSTAIADASAAPAAVPAAPTDADVRAPERAPSEEIPRPSPGGESLLPGDD